MAIRQPLGGRHLTGLPTKRHHTTGTIVEADTTTAKILEGATPISTTLEAAKKLLDMDAIKADPALQRAYNLYNLHSLASRT